jgi:mannose-6-phosphate isomerase-like protein (cupin superfamily)
VHHPLKEKLMETKEEKLEQETTHIRPSDGRSLRVLDEVVTYKITSERTGGAYSLFEVVSEPGSGLPPHIQHREDEAFYILEGEYEFLDDDGHTIRVGKGSLVYVSKGNLHTYKNVGTTLGKMLVSQTPGGLHKRFFEEISQEEAQDKFKPTAHEGAIDAERIVAIAATYGIEVPSPAPS